ncbi:MAG: hypothetical protein FIA89_08940 [Geobacter sp.]|nr:hypothetical protein [Geobacter sp.]
MTIFNDRDAAYTRMLTRNRAYHRAGNFKNLAVLVDGPSDGQFAVMPLDEAIAGEFMYEWAV